MSGEDDVSVRFGAETGDAISSLNNLRFAIEGLSNPLRAVRNTLGELGEAFIAAFAVDQILEFEHQIDEAGAKIEHLSIQLGESATEISKFAGVAGLMDVSTDTMGMSMSRLERNIAKAAEGTGPAVKAFQDLGVKVVDSSGHIRSLSEILPDVADGMKNMHDPMQRMDDAIAIGGRGFMQMIPVLAMGSQGLKDFGDQVAATGVVMNNEMAEGFEQSAIKTKLYNDSVQGLGITIAQTLKPGIDALTDTFREWIEEINQSIQRGGAMFVVWQSVIVIFDALVFTLDTAIQAVRLFGKTFMVIMESLISILVEVGHVVWDAMTGQLGKIATDVQAGTNRLKTIWSNYGQDVGTMLKSYADREWNVWQHIGDTGNRKPDAPKHHGGKAPLNRRLALQELEDAEKLALAKIALEKAADDEAFQLGKETIDQWYQAEKSAEEQSYAVKKNFYNQKAELDKQDVVKHAADLAAIAQLEVAHTAAMDKLYATMLEKKKQMDAQYLAFWVEQENEKLKHETAKYDAAEKSLRMTLQEKIAAEKAATVQIDNEIIARLQAERDSYAVGTAEWQRYNDQIVKIAHQRDQQIEKLDDQLQQHWAQVSNRIAQGLGSALGNMLTTTQTWQQMMINMLNRMVNFFIEHVIDPMIASWLEGELAKTAATQSGTDARTILDTAAQLLGITTAKTSAMAQTAVLAGLAGAGGVASMAAAPFPLDLTAPAFGAQMAALTSSFAVASAAGGMVVDDDMLANIHKDEMVLPAHLSQGIQGMITSGDQGGGVGGGDTYHFNVSAVDGQSVARYFANNSHAIVAAMAKEKRNLNPFFGKGLQPQ